MREPAAAAAADGASAHAPRRRDGRWFEEGQVEEVVGLVVREAVEAVDWRVSVEVRWPMGGDSAPVAVQIRELDGSPQGMQMYRVTREFEGVPAGFAARRLVARSRGADFNEFVRREVLIEELEQSKADPDGLGHVGVYEQRAVYFGWSIDTQMFYASRRLPDGSALAIKLPVDLDGNIWSVRDYSKKLLSLSALHVSSTPGGCRFTLFFMGASFIWGYLPKYLNNQIVSRICAKYFMRACKTLFLELAEHRGSTGTPQYRGTLLFASGSASFSLGRTYGGAAMCPSLSDVLAGGSPYPPSPFVLSACSGPLRRPPPIPSPPTPPAPSNGSPHHEGPAIHELFFDLLGVPQVRSPAAENGEPGPSEEPVPTKLCIQTQEIQITNGMREPRVMSRVGEAMRVSLDLSLQLESMSLSEAPPLPPSPPPVSFVPPAALFGGPAPGAPPPPLPPPLRFPRVWDAPPPPVPGSSPAANKSRRRTAAAALDEGAPQPPLSPAPLTPAPKVLQNPASRPAPKGFALFASRALPRLMQAYPRADPVALHQRVAEIWSLQPEETRARYEAGLESEPAAYPPEHEGGLGAARKRSHSFDRGWGEGPAGMAPPGSAGALFPQYPRLSAGFSSSSDWSRSSSEPSPERPAVPGSPSHSPPLRSPAMAPRVPLPVLGSPPAGPARPSSQ